ncbi:hypothetical protein AB0B15_03315 [Streptomyces sp. NPDC045456]|uniref:hypothetical protein n=1 Tax=Streptomyces sp. NPDC045456 TaxID=3155254 RepID=UPI003403F332
MAQRTVLVAGTGSIKRDAVYENLADWLRYKPDGENYEPTGRAEKAEFIFLAHPDLITKTVQQVYNWTARADIEYVSIYHASSAEDAHVEKINSDALDSHACGSIEDMFKEAEQLLEQCDGETFLLVLTDPSETEGADAGVDQLIVDVAKRGVTVLDLGCALHPYPVQAATDRLTTKPSEAMEPEGEELAETEEAPQSEPLDIQTDIAATSEPSARRALEQRVARLAHAVGEYITLTGPTFGADEEHSGLILHGIKEALASVEKELAASTPEAKDGFAAAPKKRAARTGEVKRGWYNEETGEWQQVKGRPRKTAQIADIAWNASKGVWQPV